MISDVPVYKTPPDGWTAACLNLRCQRARSEFPMAFSRDPYCSDNCRKALGMGLPPFDARH